jgi:hypothetical protein
MGALNRNSFKGPYFGCKNIQQVEYFVNKKNTSHELPLAMPADV